ncbi:MAG: magnesium transporter CorA family protein [Lentisphaeria bacterium]|nr:magnesium transporter CorA family protein [Lentisphaeria bacterium]
MLQKYAVQDGKLILNGTGSARVLVYNAPDTAETTELVKEYGVDDHTLASSIDPNEPPRIEFEKNHTALIIKYPKDYSSMDNYRFLVKSMGVFLFPASQLIIIVLSDSSYILATEKLSVFPCRTAQDILLRLLYQTIRHFESHLNSINRASAELEHVISRSTENKNLLRMFTLAKGLVYYQNALSGNGSLIERIKAAETGPSGVRVLGFTPDNLELLEDLAIENQQFLNQAKIDYEVLGGLLDVRASFINNNLNIMMKNMNAIVIAISVPTFFTGVGGMSEFTAMLKDYMAWYLAYPLFFGIMILLALAIYWWIQRAYGSR